MAVGEPAGRDNGVTEVGCHPSSSPYHLSKLLREPSIHCLLGERGRGLGSYIEPKTFSATANAERLTVKKYII